MRESTIAKQRSAGPESDFARALGAELRKERVARGLTQAHLGYPLTRAFVSSVESGRTVPSLASLLLLTDRLGIRCGQLLDELQPSRPTRYPAGHAADPNRAISRRSRPATRSTNRRSPESGAAPARTYAGTAR